MTIKFARRAGDETTAGGTRPWRGRPGLPRGSRARAAAAAAVLLPSITAVTLASSGGAASAATTPLTTLPTFECYANGTVIADRPTVDNLGQYVVFAPVLYVWSNGRWAVAAKGPVQGGFEPGPDAGDFGTWMGVNPVTFQAQPNHYYAVVDIIAASDVSGNLPYEAQPMRDHVGSSYYCYTN